MKIIITRNNRKENMVTFGFVNKCYKGKEYENIQHLPFYLIKFIERWVCYETLHLMTGSPDDIAKVNHWIIGVDKIIDSTFTNN